MIDKFKYDISVIIPIFDTDKYLKKSINSILKQEYDFTHIEIILVDGYLTDKTKKICKEYVNKYSNIVYINKKSKKASFLRNEGIKKAQGKYILFLDCDAFLEKNVIKKVYNFFEKKYNEVDLVTYPLVFLKSKNFLGFIRNDKFKNIKTEVYCVDNYSKLVQTTINYCIKNEFKNTLLFDEKCQLFNITKHATDIIMQKKKIGFVSEHYYISRKNLPKTNIKKEYKEFLNFFDVLLNKYKDEKYITNLFIKLINLNNNDSIISFLKNKKNDKKLQKILKHINEIDIWENKELKLYEKIFLFLLKGVKFKKINKNRYKIRNGDIDIFPTMVIEDLSYKNGPILKGKIISFNKIKKNIEKKDFFKIKLIPIKSNFKKIYLYEFIYYSFKKGNKINFKEILPIHRISIYNKSYRLKYKIQKKGTKILIYKMTFKQKIYKILGKFTNYQVNRSIIKSFVKSIKRKVYYLSYIILYNFFKIKYKQDEKQVFFLSYSREELSGNFKFVYEKLEKQGKYKLEHFLKFGAVIKYSFKEKIYLCRMLAKSKYIFLDDYYPIIYQIKLRKGTKLIQLWHAMGAFKKVGYSRPQNHKFSLNHKNYTDAIVSSESIRKDYAEAFGISIDKIHATGVPRTDIFFDKNYKEKVKKKIYNKYPELKNKKVIMFAPTFRGDGKNCYYNFKWLDFELLENKLGNKYIFIIKLHPFIRNIDEMKLPDSKFFIDLSDEREINDLLFITDILITDYSSVIFEYSFFERPVIFYLPDLAKYKKTRDIYYPLEKYLYGEIAKNMDELIEKIKLKNIDKKRIKEFKDYFCSACDGNSTKKVIQKIMKD